MKEQIAAIRNLLLTEQNERLKENRQKNDVPSQNPKPTFANFLTANVSSPMNEQMNAAPSRRVTFSTQQLEEQHTTTVENVSHSPPLTRNTPEEEGFVTVTRRPKRNNLIGTGRNSNITAVTKRPWSLFISRASPNTTTDDIAYHVRSILPRANIECTTLKTRYPSYKSYKIGVVCESIDELLDPNNWPVVIYINM